MKKNMLFLIAFVSAAAVVNLNAQASEDMDGGDEMSQISAPPAMPGGMQMGPMGAGQGPGPGMMRGNGFNPKGPGKMGIGRGMEMPQEVEARVLEVIKRNDPAFAEKLAKLKETNEKKYDTVIAMSAKGLMIGKMSGDKDLEKDMVKGVSLEYEVRELSLAYDKASDGEKAKIKEQIKGKLGEIFDIRTKGQELRIKNMEKEISELKKGLETRKANKSRIVDQRLEQLTGNKYMNW